MPSCGAELRKSLRSVVIEYLASHDTAEVARRLEELKIPIPCQHEIVRAAIEVGLERRDHERELISQLISYLYEVIAPQMITLGFEQLILRVDDLTMDNPQVRASPLFLLSSLPLPSRVLLSTRLSLPAPSESLHQTIPQGISLFSPS